jgi:hypothetical protein
MITVQLEFRTFEELARFCASVMQNWKNEEQIQADTARLTDATADLVAAEKADTRSRT